MDHAAEPMTMQIHILRLILKTRDFWYKFRLKKLNVLKNFEVMSVMSSSDALAIMKEAETVRV